MYSQLNKHLGVAAIALVTACSPADRDAATTDTAGGAAVAADTGGATRDTGAPAAAAPRDYTNDATIVTFLNTANAYEIEGAQAARRQLTNAEARAFAQRLEKEHTALRSKVASLQKQLKITPQELGETDDLVSYHRDALQDLKGKAKGNEYDQAWLEHQVEMHRRMKDAVEDALEKTQTAQLRTLLTSALTSINGHLSTVEQLKNKVGG